MAEERVQRRLAAILAADVVGYSRLMEADEVGTRARLNAIHAKLIAPKIAADGGRIVKTTGDGMLVEFPSAVDAVRSALDIQDGVRGRSKDFPDGERIAFRVGINVGDVIVEDDDIHGDGVNLAARLEGLCGAGEVFVSGTVFDQASGKLAAVFDDLGEQRVKNIDRPVRVYRASPGSSTDAFPEARRGTIEIADKPSIAVLPFDNLSGDAEQEYFSDGIAEDIITALSRNRWLFVIARNSSFSYKGQSPDVRRVAQDLGVRYVLEGSVRKAGNRVRISAQLIEGDSGNHVWAERYDRELDDIFALQDEITERIVGAIDPAVSKVEHQRASHKRPESLDVWDMCQRGWWHRYRNTRDDYASSREYFKKALALDPNCAPALAGLSDVLAYEALLGFADDATERVDRAIAHGRRAVAIDSEDAVSHASLARAYMVAGQFQNAIKEAELAIRSNPYFANAYYSLGGTYIVMGNFEEGIAGIEKAMALSPQDIWMGNFHSRLAQAHLSMANFDKAQEHALDAVRHQRSQWPAHSYLVSALGHLGLADEARAALDELLSLRPEISIDWIRSLPFTPFIGDEYKPLFFDGLRKAGLPE